MPVGRQVHTNTQGYPELDSDDLELNFGDALERVRWRSRHVMDYSNLLAKCYAERTPYILILEVCPFSALFTLMSVLGTPSTHVIVLG